ncbi:TPA: hypothetical protein ACH3X3_004521 [Trebouxia sp. C0006]
MASKSFAVLVMVVMVDAMIEARDLPMTTHPGRSLLDTKQSGPKTQPGFQVNNLSGVSHAASAISSGNAQISGSVAFPSRVSYTAGTCNLGQASDQAAGKRRHLHQSGFLDQILGSSCQQVSAANIPAPDLSFTCGINVITGNGSNGGSGAYDTNNNVLIGTNSNNVQIDSNNSSNEVNGSGEISVQSLPCQSSAAHNIF